MPVVPNDIIRIVSVFNVVGGVDQFTNTAHFKIVSATWPDDLTFMTDVAVFLDAAYTLVNAQISTTIGYLHIDGQNLTQSILLPLVSWPVLLTGANASEMLPTQVAARPYFPTKRPQTRAALNLPPFGETTQAQGGLIDATALAQLALFADSYLGVIALAAGSMLYGAFNPEFVRFTEVDSRIVPNRFRTLRRRRLGVGT